MLRYWYSQLWIEAMKMKLDIRRKTINYTLNDSVLHPRCSEWDAFAEWKEVSNSSEIENSLLKCIQDAFISETLRSNIECISVDMRTHSSSNSNNGSKINSSCPIRLFPAISIW